MPTLQWIGREKVMNHHREVPFRMLDKKYSFGEENSGNKIIHGDNLEALKSLLPEYEGRVKCIYIDPPYNTGNEGWVYNDNVKDPRISKWLGQVVGSEIDDLTRHDKWLCMMYPRMVLLQKLLAEDGVMFISIDDNEQANLMQVCKEIFGVNNVEQYIWCLQDKTESSFVKTAGLTVRKEHEYIIACFKNGGTRFKKYEGKREFADNIKDNPDNDPRGPWFSGNISRNGIKSTTGSKYYTIVNPAGESFTRNWTLTREEYEEALKDNRIYFAKGGAGVPRLKIFPSSMSMLIQSSLFTDVHTSITGKNELKAIFGEAPFQFPKPSTLIYRLLQLITDEDSIILDSFAGSGTTAHAVLNLNKHDGGNRKFILCEMCDYSETITAERVRRVIKGYGSGKNAKEGTGGGFDYYELGVPIFDDITGSINKNVDIEQVKQYLWFVETQMDYQCQQDKYYLGKADGVSYYFIYDNVLDKEILAETIRDKSEQYIIYAEACLLSEDFRLQNNIVFKQIPQDIKRV